MFLKRTSNDLGHINENIIILLALFVAAVTCVVAGVFQSQQRRQSD